VCVPVLALNRMNQNFDDLDNLAPATGADVQDLWNRSTSIVQRDLRKSRFHERPVRASRSAHPKG
jgi:hypothetical protein